jgi:hypothetical protein
VRCARRLSAAASAESMSKAWRFMSWGAAIRLSSAALTGAGGACTAMALHLLGVTVQARNERESLVGLLLQL